MVWRIRKTSHGDYVSEYGIKHAGGYEVGYKPGCTMPAFIVYESSRFDTLKEAEDYIKRKEAR